MGTSGRHSFARTATNHRTASPRCADLSHLDPVKRDQIGAVSIGSAFDHGAPPFAAGSGHENECAAAFPNDRSPIDKLLDEVVVPASKVRVTCGLLFGGLAGQANGVRVRPERREGHFTQSRNDLVSIGRPPAHRRLYLALDIRAANVRCRPG